MHSTTTPTNKHLFLDSSASSHNLNLTQIMKKLKSKPYASASTSNHKSSSSTKKSHSNRKSSSTKSPAATNATTSPKRRQESPHPVNRRSKVKKGETTASITDTPSKKGKKNKTLPSPSSTVTTHTPSPSSTISSPATPQSTASNRHRANKASSAIKNLSIQSGTKSLQHKHKSTQKLPRYDSSINIFTCDLTNKLHCLNLVLGNIPDFSTTQQIQFLSMDDNFLRIEETLNSFQDVSMVRTLYQRLCTELNHTIDDKNKKWNIPTLCKKIISLML